MKKGRLIAIALIIAIGVTVAVGSFINIQDLQTDKVRISESGEERQIEVDLSEKMITSDRP